MFRLKIALVLICCATLGFAQQSLGPDEPGFTRDSRYPMANILDQAPNAVNGFFSDPDCDFCGAGAQSMSDNFNLAEPMAIGTVVLWGGYFPGDIPNATDVFTVNIYNGVTRAPGTLVWSGTNLPYSRMTTGVTLFGVSEYEFVLEVDSPMLNPGTYWIEIFNDTTGNTDSFFWETGDLDPTRGIAGVAYAFEAPGVTWTDDPANDMAVAIIAAEEIPTMSTWGLVIFSVLLIVGVIYLKRRQ